MANRRHTLSVLVAVAATMADTAAFSQRRIEPKEMDALVGRAIEPRKNGEGIPEQVPGMMAIQQTSLYFQDAEPAIQADLSKIGDNPQNEQIRDVLQSNIKATLTEKARSDSSISFEALTGKLTISGSRNLGGVKITGGEVNIYRASAILTGLIVACRARGLTLKECVHEVFKAVGTEIAGLMKFDDSGNKN